MSKGLLIVILLCGLSLKSRADDVPREQKHAFVFMADAGFGLGSISSDYSATGTASDGSFVANARKGKTDSAYVYGGGARLGFQKDKMQLGLMARYLRISISTPKFEKPQSPEDADNPSELFGGERDTGHMLYAAPYFGMYLGPKNIFLYGGISPYNVINIERSNGSSLKYEGWGLHLGADYMLTRSISFGGTLEFGTYSKLNGNGFPQVTKYRLLNVTEEKYSSFQGFMYLTFYVL